MEPETEKSKTCSCKCKKHAAVFLIILVLSSIVCWHVHRVPRPPIGPEPGTGCTIQFRRDALGSAGDLPVLPIARIINGTIASISISGELIAIDHEAILISSEQKRFWIPKHSILFIEYLTK